MPPSLPPHTILLLITQVRGPDDKTPPPPLQLKYKTKKKQKSGKENQENQPQASFPSSSSLLPSTLIHWKDSLTFILILISVIYPPIHLIIRYLTHTHTHTHTHTQTNRGASQARRREGHTNEQTDR